MKTLFKFWLGMCIFGILISLFSAMPTLIKQQHVYASNAQMLMSCAQKNGGFSEQMVNAYTNALMHEGLNINEIAFETHPNVGVHVQKREALSVEWTPVYKLKVFGSENKQLEGKRVRIEGFSHRYEKE